MCLQQPLRNVWTVARQQELGASRKDGHQFGGTPLGNSCDDLSGESLRPRCASSKPCAVSRGSFAIQEVLNVAADSLVAAGRLGIFTPMYFTQGAQARLTEGLPSVMEGLRRP